MKALVTGGAGFLGGALVRALVERGHVTRALVRAPAPELAALGAEVRIGDIRERMVVERACDGVDVIFHVAAKAGGWGPLQEYHGVNVVGTEQVLRSAACQGAAVVHTSSPSVVHAGLAIEGADESLPLATSFLAHYPRTKAHAEADVVAAAARGLVRALVLRPHYIWGPGDRHLLPRLVERARAGRLRRIGLRDVLTDTIYIDNCVEAHLLAADALLSEAPVNAKAYFISDGAPVMLWSMVDRLLAAAGAPPCKGAIPSSLAYGIAATLEAAHAILRIEREPLITRFAVSELSHAQWFDISAARRDLGYEPRVSIEEGLRRLSEWCRAGNGPR